MHSQKPNYMQKNPQGRMADERENNYSRGENNNGMKAIFHILILSDEKERGRKTFCTEFA
jgi:hypothetical protein